MDLIVLMNGVNFASDSAQRVSVVSKSYFCNSAIFVCFSTSTFHLISILQKVTFHLERRAYDYVLHGL
jgi:hypothetical protein